MVTAAHRQRTVKRILIPFLLAFVFLGCTEGPLRINVLYDQIQGLKKGNRVIFEANHIGEVTGVFYSTHGHYVVDLAIERNFANAATEHARFFIIKDPQIGGNGAIEMIQIKGGGLPLEEGSTVQGSTESSAISSKKREDFEKGLEDLREQFERFFEDLRSVPESEDFRKLEEEFERLAEEVKRSSKSAREKIERELLPRLREEMEKLREQLRKFGREDELEPLETHMKENMKI